jgi:hypothetical protein
MKKEERYNVKDKCSFNIIVPLFNSKFPIVLSFPLSKKTDMMCVRSIVETINMMLGFSGRGYEL